MKPTTKRVLITGYGNPCGVCGKHLSVNQTAYLWEDGKKQTIVCIECTVKHRVDQSLIRIRRGKHGR
jgi:hypothetical protein